MQFHNDINKTDRTQRNGLRMRHRERLPYILCVIPHIKLIKDVVFGKHDIGEYVNKAILTYERLKLARTLCCSTVV